LLAQFLHPCYDHRKILIGVDKRLKDWLEILVYGQFSEKEKQNYWPNSLNHIQDDHSNCPTRAETKQWPRATLRRFHVALNLFLQQTSKGLRQTRLPFHPSFVTR
jgi:hypothetical protein